MASANPYDDLLAEDANPYDSVIDDLEAEETGKDNELRQLASIATSASSDYEGILKTSKTTGAPVDMVERAYPEWKKAAASQSFDPRQFRQKQRDLYELVTKNPELAPVVMKDQKLSEFAKLNSRIGLWGEQHPWLKKAGQLLAPWTVIGPDVMNPMVGLGIVTGLPELPEKRVAYQKSEIPTSDQGALGKTVDMVKQTFSRRRRQSEISALGVQAMAMDQLAETLRAVDPTGQDTQAAERAAYDIHKQIVGMQQELGAEPDYEEKQAQRMLLDVTEGFASQVDTYKGLGAGAAVGAGVGAVAGALGGKSPTAAAAGAKVGARVGGMIGTFLSTFEAEAGGDYLENLAELDDKGEAMDPTVARGAALLSGIAKSLVESAETFGVGLGTLGPAGAFLQKGATTKGALALAGKSTMRAEVARLSKAFAEGVVGEGLEEYVQEWIGLVGRWAGSSVSSGEAQAFDFEEARTQASEAAWKGAMGGIGIGAGQTVAGKAFQGTLGLASRAVNLERSRRGAAQAHGLQTLAESPTAKAAPKAVAKMVIAATERLGRPVREVFVDPVRFTEAVEAAGLDPVEVARELMGPEGPAKIQEATSKRIDEDGRRASLAVPLESWFEKWGPHKVAMLIANDMTAVSRGMTTREMSDSQVADEKTVAARTKEIVANAEQPATPAEAEMVKAIEASLTSTGKYDETEVQNTVAQARAVVETLAQRAQIPADQLFAAYTVKIQNEAKQESTAAADVKAVGSEMLQAVKARRPTREILREAWENDTHEGRRQTYFTDHNTGLLNRRGLEAAPRDAARPFLAEWDVEGFKFLNDRFGHETADAALRKAASALHAALPDAAKIGGSLRAYVRDQAHLDELTGKLQEAVGPEMRVTSVLAPTTSDLTTDIDTTSSAHKAFKGAEFAAGRLGHRKGAPASVMKGAPTIAYEEGMVGIPLDSPEAQAALENAATALEPAAARLRATLANQALGLTQAHEDTFSALTNDQTFESVHYDENGLLTEEGFRRALEADPEAWVASADMRGLKVSDKLFGREGADAVAAVFSRILAESGVEFSVARLHGDEFAGLARDRHALNKFFHATAKYASEIVLYAKRDDGSFVLQEGVYFAHGIGRTYDKADRVALPANRKRQDESGRVRAAEILSGRDFSRRVDPLLRRGASRHFFDVRLLGSEANQGAHGDHARGHQYDLRRVIDELLADVSRLNSIEGSKERTAAFNAALEDSSSALWRHRSQASAIVEAARLAGELKREVGGENKATAGSLRNAYSGIMEGVGDEHESEAIDARYLRWMDDEQRGPKPYDATLADHFDALNQDLGALEGENRVSGVAEYLHRKLNGDFRWTKIAEAVKVIQRVKGYDKVALPQGAIEQLAAAREEVRSEPETEPHVNAAGVLVDENGEELFQTLYQGKRKQTPEQEAQDLIDREEDSIRGHDIEHLLVVGSNGKPIAAFMGKEDRCGISAEALERARADGNVIFTHNHPIGFTISAEDLCLAVVANAKEIRATTREGGTHVLKRPADGWGVGPDEMEFFKVRAETASASAYTTATKRMDAQVLAAGGIPGHTDAKGYSDEAWKKFVNEERDKEFKALGQRYKREWNVEHESPDQRATRLGEKRARAGQEQQPEVRGATDEVLKQGAKKQTESPEFRAWFKKSKVVDRNGAPLRVYHGTTKAFTSFDPNKVGDTWGADEVGFFLSNDPRDANGYTGDTIGLESNVEGGNIIPAYVSLQRPLIIDSKLLTREGMQGVFEKEDPISFWDNYQKLALEWARKKKADGIIIVDESMKLPDGEPKRLIVAFKPEQIKSAIGNRGTFDPNDPNILKQGDDQDTRGLIKIAKAGLNKAFTILLKDHADLSTPLHELSHAYLEMLGDLAQRDDVPQQVKDDFAQVLKHVGAKDRESLTRDQKEKFAASWEAYLMEGKAPSLDLVPVFTRFRAWLLRIYKSIQGLAAMLGVEPQMNDDIRGVFDRMLATDQEIELMRQASGLNKPLFATAEEAGMTSAEFAKYMTDRNDEMTRAAVRVQREVAEAQKRVMTDEWKKEVRQARKKAEEEFDKRQDYRLWRFLQKGELTSEDGKVLEDVSGPDQGLLDRGTMLKVFGKRNYITQKLRGRLAQDGLMPADVAKQFGFKDAVSMWDAFIFVPQRDKFVREQAENAVKAAHPELAFERDRIEEMAQRAYHAEGTADSLIKEWVALLRKGKIPGMPPVQAMQRAARELAEGTTVRRLSLGNALANERRAAERTIAAAAKGDFETARREKEEQIVQHFLYGELSKAREMREHFEDLTRKLQDRKHRATLTKAGQEYVDAIDTILEAVGAAPFEPNPEIRNERTPLLEALKSLEQDGLDLAVDPDVLVSLVGSQANWHDLTVGELQVLRGSVAQLYTAARDRNTVLVEGRRQEIAEIAGQILTEAKERKDKGPAPGSETAKTKGKVQKPGIRQTLQGVSASMTDPEEMLRELAPTAHRIIWNEGYIKTREAEDALTKEVTQVISDMWENLPKELQESRYDLLEDLSAVPFPEDVNRDSASRDRMWMWMVALNMGNESNKERLMGGYSWDEAAVRKWLDDNMTEAEWHFVQGVWDLMDKKLWPEVAKAYKDVNGIEPPKIAPTPFRTKWGVFTGGYFPARYDPVASRLGQAQSEESITKMYGTQAARMSVVKGFTKERAKKYKDVVNLQWGVVPAHVVSVIRYVTHDRFVRGAQRILTNGSTQAAIQRHMGMAYQEQLTGLGGWLPAVANFAADSIPGAIRDASSMLQLGRSRMVVSTLGWSLSVAAGDLTNPLVSLAAGHVSAVSLTAAAIKTLPLVAWKGARKEALEKSPELRHRDENLTKLLRDNLSQIGRRGVRGKVGHLVDGARDSAWWLFEQTDKLASTIIWQAAYMDGLKKDGATEESAVAHADEQVRRALPSHDAGEQPSILRDKRGFGSLIAFHGYFNKLYNVTRGIWDENSAPKAMARTLAVILVANVFGELLSGRGPEDDEEPEEWVLRKTLAAPFSMIPLFGFAGEWASSALVSKMFGGEAKLRPFSMRASPAAAGVERLVKHISRLADEDRDNDQRFWDAIEAFGVVTGMPFFSAQVGRTGRYITGDEGLAEDLDEGDVAGMASGTLYGERENQPKNPLNIMAE